MDEPKVIIITGGGAGLSAAAAIAAKKAIANSVVVATNDISDMNEIRDMLESVHNDALNFIEPELPARIFNDPLRYGKRDKKGKGKKDWEL